MMRSGMMPDDEACWNDRVESRVLLSGAEAADRFFMKIREAVRSLRGKRIVLLGEFPGNESAGMLQGLRFALVRRLLTAGCSVVASGAHVATHASALLSHPGFTISADPYEAMNGADAILVMSSPGCRPLDLIAAKHRVRRPILADAGPFLNASAVRAAGFQYLRASSEGSGDILSLPVASPADLPAALAS